MIGPGTLKLMAGASTLVVCAGGSVLVGSDPKPQSAPLKPPVSAAQPASLLIPPSCPGSGAALAARLQPAYAQYAAATGAAAKRAVLAPLPAADRQQIVAYAKAQATAAKSASGSCAGAPAPATGEMITPSVSGVTGTSALTNSYVS